MTTRKAVKKAAPKAKVAAPVPVAPKEIEGIEVVAREKDDMERRIAGHRNALGSIALEIVTATKRFDYLERQAAVASAQLEEAEAGYNNFCAAQQAVTAKP